MRDYTLGFWEGLLFVSIDLYPDENHVGIAQFETLIYMMWSWKLRGGVNHQGEFINGFGELKQRNFGWAGHFRFSQSVSPSQKSLRWQTSDWCPLPRCRSWPSSDFPGHSDWRWKPTGAVNSHEFHLGPSRLLMINPHSPVILCRVVLCPI